MYPCLLKLSLSCHFSKCFSLFLSICNTGNLARVPLSKPEKAALLQSWPSELMMTASALDFTRLQGWPWLFTSYLQHTLAHKYTHIHRLTGYEGTCLWQCFNSWNGGHPSALGLILGPAPWWVIDTDDKPVWGSYRAANPSTVCHLLNSHSPNHRPKAKLNNPLPL